jgi:hypothetical protein
VLADQKKPAPNKIMDILIESRGATTFHSRRQIYLADHIFFTKLARIMVIAIGCMEWSNGIF